MADQDDNARLRGPPVTASLDLDFRPALNRLLSAVGNLDSGVAAKEPGACHDGRGRERDQGHRSAAPSQLAAGLRIRIATYYSSPGFVRWRPTIRVPQVALSRRCAREHPLRVAGRSDR